MVHTLALTFLWIAPPERSSNAREPAAVKNSFARIFLAPPSLSRSPIRPPNPSPKDAPAIASDESNLKDAPIDLSAILLSFRTDARNQLPAVVQAHQGFLALLDTADPSIARYIFRPPNWQAEETTQDVTGSIRILMDPPEKWPVFQGIAARNGLDLRSFRACAVFDISYRGCLQGTIRGGLPPKFAGRVVGAKLEFTADRPCGVTLVNLTLADGK